MRDTRFSALHVFITLSNIKHDQQLFFTRTEPTINKNDFHHHIDLGTDSIVSRIYWAGDSDSNSIKAHSNWTISHCHLYI
ncbi:hypothetical protein Q8A67_024870 [Cirrhinus molitorella]|uniref:Uncharacterized protein n=1 Tax=Cirrhinus molitorella TaxID=172907 RepID=A0AA88P4F4_9TELE|nr:hypothetical protein Q8A67_024870 [Cirrhinus molitorella]